jgi:hypothetical protein
MPKQFAVEDFMYEKIVVERVSAGTVIKLTCIGMAASIIPFAVLMGLLATGGASTLQWNGQPITGLWAVISAPFIGIFCSALMTIFSAPLMILGLWLYSLLRPITLRVKPLSGA